MYRFVGLAAILAAGFAAGVAWSSSPPIIVGTVTVSTVQSTTGAQETTTAPASSTGTTTSASTTTKTTTPRIAPQSASLAASSRRARARPVALTLTLRYEMQCGSPGRGSLVLDLPAQVRVPRSLPAASALLDGKRIGLERAPGNALRAALPAPPAVLCDSITEGTLKLVVTKAADLGNPIRAGVYAFKARAGTHDFRTTLRIKA